GAGADPAAGVVDVHTGLGGDVQDAEVLSDVPVRIGGRVNADGGLFAGLFLNKGDGERLGRPLDLRFLDVGVHAGHDALPDDGGRPSSIKLVDRWAVPSRGCDRMARKANAAGREREPPMTV